MSSEAPLPELSSPRLVLRWLEPDDASALFRIYSDPEAMKYWSSLPMTSEGDAHALLDGIAAGLEEGRLFEWGVALQESDEVIGTVTLASLDGANKRAEIGFMLDRAMWRRGYMSEALRTLLDYAFGALGLERIEADVDPRNESSLRLLERLGFQREGYLRERWRVGGGVQDTVLLGLLRREWQARS